MNNQLLPKEQALLQARKEQVAFMNARMHDKKAIANYVTFLNKAGK